MRTIRTFFEGPFFYLCASARSVQLQQPIIMGAYLKYFPDGTKLPDLDKIGKLKEKLNYLVIMLDDRPMSFRNIPKDKLLCVTQMHPTHDALSVIYDEREWDIKCRPYSDENDREYALIDIETVVNCCLHDGGLDIRPHLNKEIDAGKQYDKVPLAPLKGVSAEIFYRKGFENTLVFFGKDPLNGRWFEVMDIKPSAVKDFTQGCETAEMAFPEHNVYEREVFMTGVLPWTFEKEAVRVSRQRRKKLSDY